MEVTGSESDEKQTCTSAMYKYDFHLLYSINYLEEDHVRLTIQDINKFTGEAGFYNVDRHDYLRMTLNFVLRMSHFFIKDRKREVVYELLILVIKIIDGIKNKYNKKKCGKKFKDYIIATMINLISLLLKSHKTDFKIEASHLLAEIIDISFVKFSDIRSKYYKTVIILKDCGEISALGSLFYKVISSKARVRKSESRDYPSYLNFETECLNCLKNGVNNEEQEIMMKCLVVLYHYKHFDFSSAMPIMLPFMHKVCPLIRDTNCRHFVRQLLADVIVKKNYFKVTSKQIYREIHRISDRYEEWPSAPKEVFFMLVYFLMLTSECIWDSEEILQSICFYVQHNCRISDDGLKALVMVYASVITYTIADQNIRHTGDIILNHLRDHKNLTTILTCHPVPLQWIFENADNFVIYKVLESWFQIENDRNKIADIFRETKMAYILIDYVISCTNDFMLLKILNVLIILEAEKQLSQAIHEAITKVCCDIKKLQVLLRANFELPEELATMSKHLQVLYMALPLFYEEAAFTAGCQYLIILLDHLNEFGVCIQFACTKLNLLCKFLISVCCFSDDGAAIAASMLLIKLVESDKLSIEFLVPFRDIIKGSSERINSGLELFYRLLLQENCATGPLNNGTYLSELYKYIFDSCISDATIYSVVKVLKLLSEIRPELYHLLGTILFSKISNNSEETKTLLNMYFLFARSVS